MTFNPLTEQGIPLDKQLRNWRELDVEPLDPDATDPYTRCRVIVMNGIEIESIMFSHHMARTCPDPEVKRQLAYTRYIEAQQQKVVNWLLPPIASTLETTIAYEQVAVDLTAWIARMEPDPYLTQAYEFGVLEDFDHLYRYANLFEMIERRKAEKVVDGLTEVMPGRPTKVHHRHPYDNVRDPYDRNKVNPLSKLHALTVMSAEQQTMNFYMNVGPQYMEPIARQLYVEIGMIEQEHVTHYESLVDPGETWWERLVNHEYNEVYLYHSFMTQEPDPKVKAIWELHLNMELEQLRVACDLMRRFDGREPEEVLAPELPAPVTFEPNKEYLRHLLGTQIDLTTLGAGYVRDAHERFEKLQEQIHGGEEPASERVIDMHRERFGTEYRVETEGPHPVSADGTDPTDGVDVIDLLLAQHARIEELFRTVAAAEGKPKRVAWQELIELLAVHETAEEEIVHPLARGSIDAGDDIVDARLAEEHEAKELLKDLVELGSDAPDFDDRLTQLKIAVLEHATREERYEFMQLRAALPPQRLVSLAGALRAAEAVAPTRPHPGAESATANLVLGPPLAMVDAVRNAIRTAMRD